ncbi:MAG: SocA family protein [Chloroflexia bacterium]|nr:SocA family protein [Chloroflexia bacterium]
MPLYQRPPNANLNTSKLEEVIVYFLTHPAIIDLGKTKLMKLLYYADFDHFEQFDTSITGSQYIRLDHGPVPDDALGALKAMQQAGTIAEGKVSAGAFDRFSYQTERVFDPSLFSADELATLDRVTERFRAFSTRQIEMATHGEAPWLAVRPNEVVPYHLTYYRNNFGAMDLDDEFEPSLVRLTEDDIFAPDIPNT